MKIKNIGILVAALLLTANICFAQDKEEAKLIEKAANWVAELNLNNKEKETQATEVISTHLIAVRNWHNSHPFDSVPAGINPVTGQPLSELDRSIIADSAMPRSVHEALMTGLKTNLNDTQVEAILDKYTIGKVAFTLKAYHVIVTDLTPEEETVILNNLKEAREMAVDYKSMKQISAIFEIYKTKNEHYLNSNGRSWRQLYSDNAKRIKAEKAKKKQ
ncbi:DUF3826 domain-containing protein [Mariniflexile litorale]|uniref:DUF3826 domain-containing protein n=1 Tax=Mariniflexile litorale TaxID=3045158 RepID=A0AAU7EL36_9FLAO|nr:DUF3826 domain-containing protein [Mariniflexile sp. KMM 9835]MDQ8211288.1 DUF3826 domain-containing protein [Mariniflexile sp. KMM 9835]